VPRSIPGEIALIFGENLMDEEYELESLAGEAIGAEIIGALQDIIGKVNPSAARAMKRARALDPAAVMVRDKELADRRRKILTTDGVSVGAGVTTTITYETQELFRPERYVVSGSIAEDFVIEDILVGTRSQFAATGECPAEIFRPDAVGVEVHFETANVGNKIKVTVTNTSAGALTFRAAFIGTSVS
jgi:hypothetical protein